MSNIFFGIPKGIRENQIFDSRISLVENGLHRSTQRGIDGNSTEGASAIVLSGGYEDDKDYGDEIIYTGEGGNDRSSKKQICDQVWDSPGNGGLLVSQDNELPIRVIRGHTHKSPFSPSSGYKFCGLFYVIDSWEEIGKSGFKVCRFHLRKSSLARESQDNVMTVKIGCLVLLEPIDKEAQWYSVGIESPKCKALSKDSNLVKAILGKSIGDFIEFGVGFTIKEIKKYKSES